MAAIDSFESKCMLTVVVWGRGGQTRVWVSDRKWGWDEIRLVESARTQPWLIPRVSHSFYLFLGL